MIYMKLLCSKDNLSKPTTLEELVSDVSDVHKIGCLFVNHLDVRRVDIYEMDDIDFIEPENLGLIVKSYEVYKIPRTRNKVQLRVRV